jgi:hypothetical protein
MKAGVKHFSFMWVAVIQNSGHGNLSKRRRRTQASNKE